MTSQSSSFSKKRPLSSSSPNLRRRSLNDIRQLNLIDGNPTPNNSIVNVHHLNRSTAQSPIQLEHLQLDPSISERNSPSPVMMTTTTRHRPIQLVFDTENRSSDEDELTEQLKELINGYMTTRPDPHSSYATTIRWTVDHGNQMNYSVVIRIDQPADLV